MLAATSAISGIGPVTPAFDSMVAEAEAIGRAANAATEPALKAWKDIAAAAAQVDATLKAAASAPEIEAMMAAAEAGCAQVAAALNANGPFFR